jgi:DNA-binding CsgD family transcriptional regulator
MSNTKELDSMNSVDHVQYFVRLLNISQQLWGQTHGVADRLCKEVALGTQGCAQLFLHHQGVFNSAQIPPLSRAIGFPVRSGERNYGTLYIALDPEQPTHPMIPADVAHSFALLCSMLLYTFEVSALMQAQYQRLEHRAHEPLTKRQQEILTLLCRGYDREQFAKALSISQVTVDTHRQHIYEHFGIHNKRDLLLAAYQASLFSPLEAISGKRG